MRVGSPKAQGVDEFPSTLRKFELSRLAGLGASRATGSGGVAND